MHPTCGGPDRWLLCWALTMGLASNPLEFLAVACFTLAAVCGAAAWLLQRWLQVTEGSTIASCLRLVLQGMPILVVSAVLWLSEAECSTQTPSQHYWSCEDIVQRLIVVPCSQAAPLCTHNPKHTHPHLHMSNSW